MQIVAPLENASGINVNEDGMVLQVKYGEFTGLLTGDMGEETEQKLLEMGDLEDVDFLKVGHHGSHYSTSQQFLDKIKPEYAIISCSSTNTYGHPAPGNCGKAGKSRLQGGIYHEKRCSDGFLAEGENSAERISGKLYLIML